jgi:hypothetical protein
MGAILLGGIAHLMIFQNGYWNDALWISAILTVGVPIAIYKYLQTGKRKKRSTRLTPKEL